MISEIKAGAILNYVNQFIRIGIGLFLTPYIITCLGQSEYGLYSVAGSIVSYIALMDFGLTASTGRFLSEYRAKGDAAGEAHFLGNITALFAIIAGLIFVCGLTVYPWLASIFPNFTSDEMRTYRILFLMALSNVALCYPLNAMSGILTSRTKFAIPGVAASILSCLNVVGTILILHWGYRSVALLGINIVTGILGLIFNATYAYICLGVRLTWNGWDFPLCKRVYSFSIWVFLSYLSGVLSWGTGNFILGMTGTAADISVFAIGLALFSYYYTFSNGISGLFLSKVVHLVTHKVDSREITLLMVRVGRVLALILFLMLGGLIFFGRDFLTLWVGRTLGARVEESWRVAVILCLALTIPATQNLGQQILQARDMVRYNAVAQVLAALVGLVCGYILSIFYGGYGVAIGIATSFILGRTIYLNYLFQRCVGLDMPLFFKATFQQLIPVLLLPFAAAWGLNILFPEVTWMTLIAKMVCFTLIYTASLFCFYMTPEERALFRISYHTGK